METLLTPEDIAGWLKINLEMVRRKAQTGEFPAFKVGGLWRFRREAIEKYLQGQEGRGPNGSSRRLPRHGL